MTTANAHALFTGLQSEASYLANLTITDREHKTLMGARELIRATLRAAFKQISQSEEVWDEVYRRRVIKDARPAILVKFMTQGSFAYKTLNTPALPPYQEIDLDDGMYVPVEFLDKDRPALMAKTLFTFVETALAPLCVANGWKLDSSKSSCVRVKIWAGAHVDIPIYSIPASQFAQIIEKVAASTMNRALVMDSASTLRSDQIMLAQRDGIWTQSDPQKLHEWVENRVKRYGPIYRRLCRFFKGWRDATWAKPELSSICLMHAINTALEQFPGAPLDTRDDTMIYEVAKRLPAIFRGEVCNAVLKDSCLNSWSAEVRQEIVEKVEALASSMAHALERCQTENQVIAKLVSEFGTRIPDAPDGVKFAETKIQSIQVIQPTKVPAPKVQSSTSG